MPPRKDPIARLRLDLEKGLRPSYLILGKDAWWLGEAMALFRAKLAESGSVMEFRQADRQSAWPDLDALLRNYSMFEERKVVHLSVPGKLSEDFRDGLRDYLDEEPGRNVLVITAPSQEQLRAAKNRVEKQGGLVLSIAELKDQALQTWTSARMEEQGLRFQEDIPGALLSLVPPEPGELAAEIDKISMALGEGASVTLEDLERLVTPRTDLTIWRLTNALVPGNTGHLLRVLDEFIQSGEHKPAALTPLMGGIALNLLKARSLLDEGLGREAASAAMGGKPFWSRKMVDIARKADRGFFLAWVLNLQKLDARLKRNPEDRARELMESYVLESMAGRILPA